MRHSATPSCSLKSLRNAILYAAIASFASLSAVAQSPAPAFTTNPKYVAAMAEAKEMLHKRQVSFAADAFKKANKIAEGKDPVCLEGLYDAQLRLGSYKDAVKTADALVTLATTPATRAKANVERGTALYRQAGDKAKPELLEAADAAYKAALVDDPRSVQALYMDGYVLARLNRMDAAKQAFTECLSCLPARDPSHIRVEHLQENPALATAKMAPPFTVVALDGSKFTLDAMTGRVVLIDFWATWCGPCNEELPHMKKIAKDFAGEPLVIISVSWDADEAKWKQFIAKNEMTWVQYRDADHELSRLFSVNAIPHYFTIDSDGVLTAEMLGSGSDVEGKLKKLIARAKAERPQTATLGTQ